MPKLIKIQVIHYLYSLGHQIPLVLHEQVSPTCHLLRDLQMALRGNMSIQLPRALNPIRPLPPSP